MAVTEESRYRLFKQLEDTLGAEHANTLMGHLPPVGWADVATKGDVESLRRHVDVELGRVRNHVDTELGALRRDLVQLEERIDLRWEAALSRGLHRQFVQIIASVAAMLTVMLTLAVTVNQLLGG